MQTTPVKLHDVIALLDDKPAEKLVAGQVGTVVEILGTDVFEVEFLSSEGRTLALSEVNRGDLLILRHESYSA